MVIGRKLMNGKKSMIVINSMNYKIKIFSLLLLILSGCSGFIYHKNINELYAIIAVDTTERAGVCRKVKGVYEGRMGNGILKVGIFKHLIFAEKRNGTFWVLDINKDSDHRNDKKSLSGPYTFDKLKTTLKQYGLNENIVFKWHVK